MIGLAGLVHANPTGIEGTQGNRLIVYWGARFDGVSLDGVCNDPSYDVVNLAFLTDFFFAGGYFRLRIAELRGSSPRASQCKGPQSYKTARPLSAP